MLFVSFVVRWIFLIESGYLRTQDRKICASFANCELSQCKERKKGFGLVGTTPCGCPVALQFADEAAGIEPSRWIEFLLDFLHERMGGRGWAPDIDGLLQLCRRGEDYGVTALLLGQRD